MTNYEAIGNLIWIREVIQREVPWKNGTETIDFAIEELKKQEKYRRHDVRKDPDDLPEGTGRFLMLCGDGIGRWYESRTVLGDGIALPFPENLIAWRIPYPIEVEKND